MPRRRSILTEIESPIEGPVQPRINRRYRYHRSFRRVMGALGVDIDEGGAQERVALYFIYRALRDIERIIREEYPR